MQERLFAQERAGRVSILWNHTVEEILDDGQGVSGLKVRGSETLDHRVIPVTGVFIAIGHSPNTHIFAGQLAMQDGYIEVTGGAAGNATATSIPGVFAAGDVADHVYRQAITSAGSGCMAALDADRFLESHGSGHG